MKTKKELEKLLNENIAQNQVKGLITTEDYNEIHL